MTAENCMYWSGEGCTCEIETGIRCKSMTNDFVPQCNGEYHYLIECEDENQ